MRQHRMLDRGAAGSADSTTAPVVGKSTLTEALGSGESLPSNHRAQFEKSLGRNLSSVQIHTADHASRLAEVFGSRAFASGSHIAFAKGEYDPNSRAGTHLLAHEVAHVAQQAGAAPTEALATTQPEDAVESNADAAATAMVAGRPAQVAAAPLAVARKTRGEPREPAAHAPAAEAGDAGATSPGDKPTDEIGELTAARVGQEVDEGNPVAIPVRNTEGAKHELAGAGHQLPHDGGAEGLGGAPDAGGAGGGGAGTAEAGVVRSPDGGSSDPGAGTGETGTGEGGGSTMAASVQQAQQEAREAAAAAEAESAAYQTQVTQRREKFEAEQHDTVVAQLKAMSPTDKRSTLVELGYDPKKIGQLKDAELDSLISGKLEAEQQKAKILGMTPEELAKLSSAQKTRFLADLGIDRGDLDKAGAAKTDKLFDDVTRAAHIPGTHNVKVQIKGGLFGKSWVVNVKCDTDGGVDVQAKKEGGIFAKLLGWIKAALPIALAVLTPLTGGASLIVAAVYQTISAIKTGNWLGAVIGVAGAVAGLGALAAVAKGTGGLAQALGKVASVAGKVKNVAQAAQAAMVAAKAKNAGSLLAALAGGAAAFASFAGNAAGKFAETMKRWSERLQKWSKIAEGGQKVVKSIQSGDPIGAIGNALATAGAVAGGKSGKDLQRAANITSFVNAGRKALQSNPPNYNAVADAAFGIAKQLSDDRRIDDAQRIVAAASRLRTAWNARASNPGGVAEAVLGLAESIQLARYDLDHKETKDGDGKPLPEAERAKIMARYERSTKVVKMAGTVLTAATARPPNTLAILDAVTQLVAELTDDKRLDAAAVVTSRGEALRRAIASGNPQAIAKAAEDLARAIDGMRKEIEGARDQAKHEAQTQLPEGTRLSDAGGALPQLPPTGHYDASGPSHASGEYPTSSTPGSERVHGPQADPDPEAGPAPAGPTPAQSPKPAPSPPVHKTPSISGVVVAGGPLRDWEVDAIDKEARFATPDHRHYIAYENYIHVGGALPWRANNPGSLRHSPLAIGSVPAAGGVMAVFATVQDGRDGQQALYETTYAQMTVRTALPKLSPQNENNVPAYLAFLERQGIDLDKTVESQMQPLMDAIARYEGKEIGIMVQRKMKATF